MGESIFEGLFGGSDKSLLGAGELIEWPGRTFRDSAAFDIAVNEEEASRPRQPGEKRVYRAMIGGEEVRRTRG